MSAKLKDRDQALAGLSGGNKYLIAEQVSLLDSKKN